MKITKENGDIVIKETTSAEGGWLIICKENEMVPLFEVYEIPMYGGKPDYDKTFHTLVSAIDHTKIYI